MVGQLTAFLLFSAAASAQSSSTVQNGFVVEGRLYDGNNQPLESESVNLRIEVIDPANQCVLYREFHLGLNVVADAGNGMFAVSVGRGTNPQIATGVTFDKIFSTTTLNGDSCSSSSGDRALRIYVDRNGADSVNNYIAIYPDTRLLSSPSAMVAGVAKNAEALGGVVATDYLQKNDQQLNQSNLDYIFSNARFSKLQDLVNGTSTQYLPYSPGTPISLNGQKLSNLAAPTADGDAATKSYVDSHLGGRAIANTTPNAGEVLKWNGSAWAPAADAVGITALTGDITASGSGSVTATLNSDSVTTSKLADDSITSAKLNSMGGGTNRIVMTDGITGANLTYASCSAVNQVLAWTPTGWQCKTMNAVGAVTSVNGQIGAVTLNAGDIAGLGLAALRDYGTAANELVILDQSARLPAVDGRNLTNVSASSLKNGLVTWSLPAADGTANQVLTTNGSGVLSWTTATSGSGGSAFSLSASPPLSVADSGSNKNLTLTQASGASDGYLSSADWTAFNGKSPAAGSAAITTLGTISSGTWQGSIIGPAYGGTGVNASSALDGQLLIGNGSGFELGNLNGTPNQVNVSYNSSGLMLSTPQNIHTMATPSFAGLNLSSGNLTVMGQVRMTNSNTQTVGFRAPTAITTDTIWTLPSSDGTNGQVLATNGTGGLIWIDNGSGGGGGSGGVSAVSANPPLASSGGAIPTITMAQATSSADGYLSSADWNSFNSKSPAAGSSQITTLGTVSTGTWNANVIGVNYGGTGTNNGSITGTGSLNFSAGGSNENVTLSPSGTGSTVINSALRLNGSSSGYSGFKAADTSSTSVVYTLPPTPGAANQVLTTDGNGMLSWTTVSSGGSGPVTGGGDLSSLSVTTPLTLTDNGTSKTLSLAQASNTNNGFLSSSDWNTFSSKSPAAGSTSLTTLGTVTTGTWNASTIGVAHGGTGSTTGSITGTGALSFSAGGTDQNITLTPSGNGNLILNGKIGIGVSDPQTKVDIGGGLRLRGSNTGSSSFQVASNATATVNYTLPLNAGSSGQVLSTDGSGVLSWTTVSSGGGGSGTTFPLQAPNGQASTPSYSFTDSASTGWFSPEANSIAISTNGAERVRVLSNGNVGFGVGDPQTKVDIGGGLRIRGPQNGSTIFQVASSATATVNYTLPPTDGSSGQVLSTNGSGLLTWTTMASGGGGGSGPVTFPLTGTDGTAAQPTYSFQTNPNAGMYSPSANTLAFATNGVEKIRIDGDGKMGLGVSTPQSQLDLVGAITLRRSPTETGSTTFRPDPASAVNITYVMPGSAGNSGQVLTTDGTGTLSWTTMASSSGGGGSVTFPILSTATGSATQPEYSFDGDSDTGWYSPSLDGLAAATGGTERLTINSAGRVGIGITSPTAKLDVDGDLKLRSTGGGFSGFKAPMTVSTSVIYTLPGGPGSPNQVLTTDGNGALSWANAQSSIQASTPLSVNSSDPTSPTVSISQADGSTDGYLSSTDWNTFNNKAPLNSPDFTGSPTAPTASIDSNSSQIATTAFVLGQGSTTEPLMSGTAAVGTTTTFARADHVHPSDTSRAPAEGSTAITTLGNVNAGSWEANIIGVNYGGTGSSNGSITGNAALTFTAGGSNENITLNPSGSGFTKINSNVGIAGNVGIGTESPQAALDVFSTTPATSAMIVPRGGGGTNRPSSPVAGMIRYNNDSGLFEAYEGGMWKNLIGGGSATTPTAPPGFPLSADQTTEGAPQYTFVNDANTGIFSPAVDNIAFATSGLERLRISPTGNIGIGTNTPEAKLSVAGELRLLNANTGYASISVDSSTNQGIRFILPGDEGASGQVLSTDGQGNLSWTTVSGGGGGGGSSISASAPLSLAGSSLSIPRATASVSGYMHKDDFATFNNKLSSSGAGTITTVGTITSGAWNAGVIPAQFGGTGYNAANAPVGSILVGKGNGTGFNLTQISGTPNQVGVANGSGTITLSTPQNIDTAATPQFRDMRLTDGNLYATGASKDIFLQPSSGKVKLRSEIRFVNSTDASAHYIGFRIPATLTSSKTWTLPTADGLNGYALVTDGNGNLTFQSAAHNNPPLMDGTASAGVLPALARGDHVHPSDTSRTPVTTYITVAATSSYTISNTQSYHHFIYTRNQAGTIELPPINTLDGDGNVTSSLSDGFEVTVARGVTDSLVVSTASGTNDVFTNGSRSIELREQNLSSVTIVKIAGRWTIRAKVEDCVVGQSCWTANTNNNMKQIFVGTLNNRQYFTTPGGCTDSVTPTCAGGTDQVSKAWADGQPNGENTPPALAVEFDAIGTDNYVNGFMQSATLALGYEDTDAAKYCDNLDYAGYTDWYLPAREELALLHRNSASVGGFDYTRTYWSSTEASSTTAWALLFDRGIWTNEGSAGTGPAIKANANNLIRCVRAF